MASSAWDPSHLVTQMPHEGRETGATRIHLFIAGPAGVALLLGHRRNVLPPVTVDEHQGGVNYAPTFHFPA